MSVTMATPKAVLPYPVGGRIKVFRDDGNWGDKWFLRGNQALRELYVVTYELPLDEDGDCLLTYREWCAFAVELLERHPGCCFVY